MKDIPKPDLQLLIDAHIKGIHNVLSSGCEHFMPKLILQVMDGTKASMKTETIVVAIAGDFNEAEEKFRCMRKLGHELFQKRKMVLAVSLASEAWMAEYKEDPRGTVIMPSQQPNRKEVIIIYAMGIDQTCKMQMMSLTRDAKGNIKPGTFVASDHITPDSPLLTEFYLGFFEAYDKYTKERK